MENQAALWLSKIAEKINLPRDIIGTAKRILGDEFVKTEDILNDLQNERRKLKKRNEEIIAERAKMDKLIKNYEQLTSALDHQRKKIKLLNKEKELSLESEYNHRLENTIREIVENQNLEKAKKELIQRKENRKKLSGEIKSLSSAVNDFVKIDPADIKVGAFARMKNGDVEGEILELNKKRVLIRFGDLKMEVRKSDLIPVKAPDRSSGLKRVFSLISSNDLMNAKTRIDIRGMKVDEAHQVLESFFDLAIVNGAGRLTILHGKRQWCLTKNRSPQGKGIQRDYRNGPSASR